MLKNKYSKIFPNIFYFHSHFVFWFYFFEKSNIFIDNMIWYYQANVFCGKKIALLWFFFLKGNINIKY
jgi:hypothetical protein